MTSAQLAHMRAKLGMTQDELAKQLGVTRNTVWRWENGTHPINHTAEKLIGLLNGKRTQKEGT